MMRDSSHTPAKSINKANILSIPKLLSPTGWLWLIMAIMGIIGLSILFGAMLQVSTSTITSITVGLILLCMICSVGALLRIQHNDAKANFQVAQLNALNRLSHTLALSDNLDEACIATRIEILNLVPNADSIAIHLIAESQAHLNKVYHYKDDQDLSIEQNPIVLARQNPTQWIAETGEILVIQKNSRDHLSKDIDNLIDNTIERSWLGLPLVVIGNKQIGVLSVGSTNKENAFSTNSISLITTAVRTLAVTVQNQQLLNQTQSALQSEARQSLELQTAIEVSSTLGGVLNPNQLMQQTIDLIKDRFDLYYVGFFLLDSAEQYAVLQAGTGKAGQEQLANNHKHAVNSRSLIGGATGDGQPRVHQDVSFAENWFANPHLPRTQSEIALPLRARGRILGALTAQSVEVNKFIPQLVQVLQAMCDQIAVALDNGTLFNQLQINIDKIDRLYQTERQLVEANSKENIYAALIKYVVQTDLFDGIRVITPNEKRVQSTQPELAHYWLRPELIAEYGVQNPLTEPEIPLYNQPTVELLRIEDIKTLNIPSESFLHYYQFKTLILFPIHLGQRWFGSLIVANQNNLPNERELQSLITLCDQAAIVLSNQNLLSETSTLYTLSRELNEAKTQNEMAHITAEKLVNYTGAKQVRIVFHDRSRNLTKMAVSHDPSVKMLEHNHIQNNPVYRRFQTSDVEFIVVDNEEEDPSEIVTYYLRPYAIQATLFVPVLSQRDLIGFIMLDSAEGYWPFTASSINFTRTAADQFAVTNENFVLFNQTLDKAQDLVTLNQIGSNIASTLDASKLSQIVHLESKRLLSFSEFMLTRYEIESSEFYTLLTASNSKICPNSFGPVPNEIAQKLHSNEPQIYNSADNLIQQFVKLFPPTDSITQSVIFMPLHNEGRPIGFMIFMSDQTAAYDENHTQLAQAIANQTALALVNTDLLAETQNTVEELSVLNERLLELDKMKTQFLANMSHELRTPLNSIIGFSRLILKGIDGPINEIQREDLNSIYHGGQHLLSLINDILDLAKLDAGKVTLVFHPVNLTELATSIQSTARGLIKEKEDVSLIWNIAEDLPLIEGDEIRLRQILLNLLSNAAKFTHNGFIHLSVQHPNQLPDFILISVQDTGVGISERDFPRLFRKFEQVDDSTTRLAEGTGLGLPIVQELTQLHNGRVWVESALNKGSVFHVLLPIKQDPQSGGILTPEAETFTLQLDPPQRLSPSDIQTPPHKPISIAQQPQTDSLPAILIVDDEPGILSLYERYLNTVPNPLITVDSGQKALNALHENPHIGLVLLDIHMPDLNGWQVLEKIRNDDVFANLPVVICSIDATQEEARNQGAQLALTKPIISDDLTRITQLIHSPHATTS